MSAIGRVIDAAMAALQAAPALAPQVERIRLRPFSASQNAAIVVRPIQADREQPAMAFAGPDVWAVRFSVECYARNAPAAPAAAPDAALDPLVQAAYARLMTDPTLSGALLSLEPERLQLDFDAEGDVTACGVFTFVARVSTGPAFN